MDRVADSVVAVIVAEAWWLPFSLVVATIAATLFWRGVPSGVDARTRTLAAMNRFYGATFLTMAFGHLLAVTVKLANGTLRGSAASAVLFYAIGIALAVPAALVARHAGRIVASADHGRATVRLNAWMALTLLAMGLHNLPIAAPGFLNIAYHRHERPLAGRAIVALIVVANAFLLIGSLIFAASGLTFEEFRTIR